MSYLRMSHWHPNVPWTNVLSPNVPLTFEYPIYECLINSQMSHGQMFSLRISHGQMSSLRMSNWYSNVPWINVPWTNVLSTNVPLISKCPLSKCSIGFKCPVDKCPLSEFPINNQMSYRIMLSLRMSLGQMSSFWMSHWFANVLWQMSSLRMSHQ